MKGRMDSGFTLIELLTIIAIIGVLASLALSSYAIYKNSATFAVIETALQDAQTSFEAGIVDPDNLPASFGLIAQTAAGEMTNPVASSLLPGFRLPRLTKFQVRFDGACANPNDSMGFMQINHCQGKKYLTWERFCDGVIVRLAVDGDGCP
jgi:prepilin-type N-terminal cleavage/methylation domain-containing protein